MRSSHKCYGEKIKIKSIDLNSLLVDFLSEILAKSYINKKVYEDLNIKQVSGIWQTNRGIAEEAPLAVIKGE